MHTRNVPRPHRRASIPPALSASNVAALRRNLDRGITMALLWVGTTDLPPSIQAALRDADRAYLAGEPPVAVADLLCDAYCDAIGRGLAEWLPQPYTDAMERLAAALAAVRRAAWAPVPHPVRRRHLTLVRG